MSFRNKIINSLKRHSGLWLLCLFFFLFAKQQAQVNLVVDPSFEIYDTCPGPYNYGCRTWHGLDSIDNTSHALTSCVPVYMNTCSTNGFNTVPVNSQYGGDFQNPRSGNGMYAVVFYIDPSPVTGNPFHNRDFLQGKLRSKLINGKSYCGKYYVCLFQNMKYATDRLCAYLDDGSIDSFSGCLPIVKTPYFENPTLNYITDTLNWTRVQGSFTANGTETYLTIGNFYSHSNTNLAVFNATSTWPDANYYVDDVSIISMEIKADGGPDQTICVGDSITLGRPQEIGLECQWFVPGNPVPFNNSSDFTFKATQTGTYTFVQRMDNCAITFDTVNITVVQACDTAFTIPNVFTPNEDGNNDTWSFHIQGATNVHFNIYNRWGNLVRTNPEISNLTYVSWDGRTTSGEKCSEGVYFYVLEYTDKKGAQQKESGYVSLFR